MKILKYSLCSIALSSILLSSGCSIFGVYKIDLPQGTPITQTQAQKVQPGMTMNQVLYLIGSPAIKDTLAPNRWDYIYDYVPGTYGVRDGKEVIANASQHFVIYFNENGVVTRVEGADSLPLKTQ